MMKKFIAAATVALFLVACQSGQNDTDTGEAEVETAAVEQAPQEARRRYQRREREQRADEEKRTPPSLPGQTSELIPRHYEGMLDSDGPGLSLIIDATSLEAFHDSLQLIASETSESQFRMLQSAIKSLQFYDMDAEPGIEGFLPRINGKTGDEIIERVVQRRPN